MSSSPYEKALHDHCDDDHVCGLVPIGTECPQYGTDDSNPLWTDITIDGPSGLSDVRLCGYKLRNDDGFSVFDPAVLSSLNKRRVPETGLDRAAWWYDNFQNSTLAQNLNLHDQFAAKVLPSAVTGYVLPSRCPALANSAFQQLDPSGNYAGKCLAAVSSDGAEAGFVASVANQAKFHDDVDQLLHSYCFNNSGDPRCSCVMSTDPTGMFQAYSAAAGSPPECWWLPCKDSQFYHLYKDNHPSAATCGNADACKNIAVVVGNKNTYIDLDQYIAGCSGDSGGGDNVLAYLKKNALVIGLVGGGALLAIVVGAILLKKMSR